MDPWLRAILEAKTGGFRSAQLAKCARCGAWTVRGLDNDICAFTVTVDPSPLDPRQEIHCYLAGRKTYDLQTTSSKATIHHRDPSAVGRTSWYKVVPEHRCGARYPTINIRARSTPQTDTPPF